MCRIALFLKTVLSSLAIRITYLAMKSLTHPIPRILAQQGKYNVSSQKFRKEYYLSWLGAFSKLYHNSWIINLHLNSICFEY